NTNFDLFFLGISWCPAETNNFYTVGRDGLLIRHSIKDGIRPVENAPPVALSFSPYGHLLHAVRKDRIESGNNLLTMDENNKLSYPATTKLQSTSVQHSNGNGSSLGYYGSSNNTSTLPNAVIASTNSNIGDSVSSSKDFEHPTVIVTSGNTDELVNLNATTTLITTESAVNIPGTNSNHNIMYAGSNINTISTTSIISATSTMFTNSPNNETATIMTSTTTTSPSSLFDSPQMGSLKSTQLFVSQAHSLLFHYKPCLETLLQPKWYDFSNALLPDLIILLANNYKFIGTNVDMICEYNANVCLRFGQPFLVRFWLLLRSIYGSLNSESNKRTASQQYATQPQPPTPSHQQVYTFSDLGNQYSKHIQSSLMNEKMVPSTDSPCVHIPDNRASKRFRNSGASKRKTRDLKTNDTTGVKLSSILESLGIRCRESAQKSTDKTIANMNVD
ncbi:unnamed protein product, partial [Schistosoma turkestanicum]